MVDCCHVHQVCFVLGVAALPSTLAAGCLVLPCRPVNQLEAWHHTLPLPAEFLFGPADSGAAAAALYVLFISPPCWLVTRLTLPPDLLCFLLSKLVRWVAGHTQTNSSR